MAYIGNSLTQQSFTGGMDQFNGNASNTTFGLSRTINTPFDVNVYVEGVFQRPGVAYTTSANTITFTSAPSTGANNIVVVYENFTSTSIVPAAGSVTPTTIAANTIQATLGYVPANKAGDTFTGATTFSNTVAVANSGVTFGDATTQLTAASGFGFKNRIINGDMRIDQRNAGASLTVNTGSVYFPVDRWTAYGQATDGVFTVQQSSVAPNGFNNSLVATVTTADSSIGAAQYYLLGQRIEGYNVADLGFGAAGASPFTISFWVRSSVTGSFGLSIENDGETRGYGVLYTINSANTWEYKTVTIPGDTTGTWLKTNGRGMNVWFSLGTGSTYSVAPNGTWNSAVALGVTGQTNLIATNGATFYITGVQLEKGSTATPFDFRYYGHELQMCQRYYEVFVGDGGYNHFLYTISYSDDGYRRGISQYKVTKRATPTVTVAWSGTPGSSRGVQLNTITSVGPYVNGATGSLYVAFDNIKADAEL